VGVSAVDGWGCVKNTDVTEHHHITRSAFDGTQLQLNRVTEWKGGIKRERKIFRWCVIVNDYGL